MCCLPSVQLQESFRYPSLNPRKHLQLHDSHSEQTCRAKHFKFDMHHIPYSSRHSTHLRTLYTYTPHTLRATLRALRALRILRIPPNFHTTSPCTLKSPRALYTRAPSLSLVSSLQHVLLVLQYVLFFPTFYLPSYHVSPAQHERH